MRRARATHPPPTPQSVEFTTADGLTVGASLYVGGGEAAPAVILAHRIAGSYDEWMPLLERLFPPKGPLNVLSLDLRGHGRSVHKKGSSKDLRWSSMKDKDFEPIGNDIEAAARYLDTRKVDVRPAGFVLIGSDIGATAVTAAAVKLGERVRAVALVSPGAALKGVDLYQPFGAVLDRPNLIVAAKTDNVSRQTVQLLAQMSKSSKLIEFDGGAHSAQFLGQDHSIMWDELADWVEARVQEPAAPAAESVVPVSSAAGSH